MSSPDREWVTVAEAVSIAGCTEGYIRRLLGDGDKRLRGWKAGPERGSCIEGMSPPWRRTSPPGQTLESTSEAENTAGSPGNPPDGFFS